MEPARPPGLSVGFSRPGLIGQGRLVNVGRKLLSFQLRGRLATASPGEQVEMEIPAIGVETMDKSYLRSNRLLL